MSRVAPLLAICLVSLSLLLLLASINNRVTDDISATPLLSTSNSKTEHKASFMGRRLTFGGHVRERSRGKPEGGNAINCQSGCPTNVTSVVCASGITFQSDCAAACQNFLSWTAGPCSEDPAQLTDILPTKDSSGSLPPPPVAPPPAHGPAQPTVSMEVMTQYAHQNFTYIGCIPLVHNNRPELPHVVDSVNGTSFHFPSQEDNNSTNEGDGAGGAGGAGGAIRYTMDGHLYYSSYDALPTVAEGGVGGAVSPLPLPSSKMTSIVTDNQQSKEVMSDTKSENVNTDQKAGVEDAMIAYSIIGADTRQVVDTAIAPYNKVAQIDYNNYSQGGCSASVIGPNTILTAGHCVYNFANKAFYTPRWIAPGRYDSNGSPVDRYGKWPTRYVTIHNKFRNSGDIGYDFAIIEVGANSSGKRIGDVVGNLSFLTSFHCNNIDASKSQISGYPADKPAGGQYTAMQCSYWYHACGSQRLFYTCDTYGGDSGSPLIYSTGYVFGVHTNGGNPNSGTAMIPATVNFIRKYVN